MGKRTFILAVLMLILAFLLHMLGFLGRVCGFSQLVCLVFSCLPNVAILGVYTFCFTASFRKVTL
jgi:hypothetical protein